MRKAGNSTVFAGIVVGIVLSTAMVYLGEEFFTTNSETKQPTTEKETAPFILELGGNEIGVIIPAGVGATGAIVAIARKFM